MERNEKKPELVIMAAGMGSRYGGLKQIDPMDEQGHIIIDFSLYDAWKAGFEKVTFLIKPELEEEFHACIGDRVSRYMKVQYAYQRQEAIPAGFSCPQGREKPWGTGHAVLCCRDLVQSNFVVINADDYYGRHSFSVMYRALCDLHDDATAHYAMLGYRLKNTVPAEGSVARGVCQVDAATGKLAQITERCAISRDGNGFRYTEDGCKSYVPISGESVVSMNFWGFTPSVFDELAAGFPDFLEKNLPLNPLKCEYYLPFAVNTAMSGGRADVRVLESEDTWYGVTYRADKPVVRAAFAGMKAAGLYPEKLLD